jgi:hypothetical protein
MKRAKLYICLLVVSLLVFTHVLEVAAAGEDVGFITGSIQEIRLETDLNTGVTTVLINLQSVNGDFLWVRISDQTALDLGLLDYDADGNPFIVEPLPGTIEIDPATILPEAEEAQHPVGSALATFFSDIPALDYSTIMDIHEEGTGFGVIAQALWITRKLGGDELDFLAIIEARTTGDFGSILLADGSTPLNWGQFRKAVLSGDQQSNLGIVISGQEMNNGNANPGGPGNSLNNGNNDNKEKEKAKKDREGDGNGHGDGNGNPNRP